MTVPLNITNRDQFKERLPDCIYAAINRQEPRRSAFFTDIMDAARSFGLEIEAAQIAAAICEKEGEPELWESPKPFDSSAALPALSERCLPPKLWSFLLAVSKSVQVAPEMGIFPLLSVLSLCVQGKAVIQHPGSSHTEPLNLYTLTIAAPGERKSGCLSEFISPAFSWQKRKNELLKPQINDYEIKRRILERQKEQALRGKDINEREAQRAAAELAQLEEVRPLRLYVQDATPESITSELAAQRERLGVLDCEGTLFDILSGAYGNGQANIGIFLESYDGSPYTVTRKGSAALELEHPLLTIGLMVQPSHFIEAVSNTQFRGRGFIQRFMFSFPEPRAGSLSFDSPAVPGDLRKYYTDLVECLLAVPAPSGAAPVLICSREARLLFKDYFDHVQEEQRAGGLFESMLEWSSKQFARALRIAGILHFAERCTKDINDLAAAPISGETAQRAVSLARWSEYHACRALGDSSETETVRNAKRILEKLRGLDKREITRSELLSKCRTLTAQTITEPLELLEALNYIRIREERAAGAKGSKQIIITSPVYYCNYCRLL